MKAAFPPVLLALAASLGAARADPASSPVKLMIVPERNGYFLGENIRVVVTAENTGAKELVYSECGAVGFTIVAADAQGKKVRDPWEGMPMMLDVMSRPHRLKPGESYHETFAINGHLQFTEQGAYTLSVTPNPTFQRDWGAYPTATASVSLWMPNSAQAETIVEAVEAPRFSATLSGRPAFAYDDMRTLCLPLYLDPLLRRAKQGDHRALEGLDAIETPEATSALIGLAKSAQGRDAQDLYGKLVNRMPNQGFGWAGSPEPHLAFVRRCWNDSLAPQTRSLAPQTRSLAYWWLAGTDPAVIGWGAALLQTVGTTGDIFLLDAALNRALGPLDQPGWTKAALENTRPQIGYLSQAIRAIYLRDPAAVPSAPKSDAEIYVYFTSRRAQRPPAPAEWKRLFKDHGGGGNVLIRQAALDSVPFPVPDDCESLVVAAMMDPDQDISAAALFASKRQIVIDQPTAPGLRPLPPQTMQLDADGENGRFLP